MISAQITVSVKCLGIEVAGRAISRTSPQGIEPVVTALSAGKASADWAKTDADTGTATMSTGHGLTTGKVDVYWDGGARYNVDATVTDDSIALDGGDGDDFPANDTPLVLSKPSVLPEDFDGDNLSVIAAEMSTRGMLVFLDAGGAVLLAHEFTADLEPFAWWKDASLANPLTGNAVASVQASAGTVEAGSLTMVGLQSEIT